MWARIRRVISAGVLVGTLVGVLGLPMPVLAQDWHEPARGTAERARLMNAMRPLVEWHLGAPVEFVVHELRATSDHAFAIVSPQRPGGGEIDIDTTPMVRDLGDDPWYFKEVGGLDFIALMIREGDQWGIVEYSIGATDVWFGAQPFCREFPAILADYCPN
ncbi:hypothetical protein [Celeribacter neptunius]|uniref:Uncharacterized protein n=1 Tax=Celeribacter neptunius TaxID=588602 RepID=A0A1I3TPY8_9RHOB|nr:hypothetical protein [Celeribacter neptunius]SFJ72680.1 hypothetical protein SAMN04487991_2822 [Celeribacter neptunius]